MSSAVYHAMIGWATTRRIRLLVELRFFFSNGIICLLESVVGSLVATWFPSCLYWHAPAYLLGYAYVVAVFLYLVSAWT
jgi:hypothetical protein